MSECPLPDDLSKWPKDPHRLLGVEHTVGSRELRRAYTRLIRTYKPETHPAEFQRIRAAYETLQRWAEWRESAGRTEDPPALHSVFDTSSPDAAAPAAADRAAAKPDDSQPAAHPPHATPALVSIDDAIDAAWNRALAGELQPAYSRLSELRQQHSASDEIPLRLYWLLRLDPALDPQREPSDWLVEGLATRGWGGRLLELYHREVDARPEETRSLRCSRLLERPAPAARAFDLLIKRWSAAGRIGGWSIIEGDLEAWRARFLPDDQRLWARLLIAAIRQLAWANGPQGRRLLAQCRDELSEYDDLHLALGQEFDDCEMLLELAHGRKLEAHADVPYAVIELVHDSWRPFAEVRPALSQILEEWSWRPVEALEALDQLAQQSTLALGRIATLVQSFGFYPDQGAAGVAPLIVDRLQSLGTKYSWSARAGLLEFCLREWISIDSLIRVAAAPNSGIRPRLTAELHTDVPLQTVVAGVLAIRS